MPDPTAPDLSPDELAAMEARCEKATEGPWFVVGPPWNDREPYIVFGDPDPHDGGYLADLACLSDDINRADNEQADAEFIAHARTDVPRLIAAVESLQVQVEAVKALLRACDEQGAHYASGCDHITPRTIRAALAAAVPEESEKL